MNISGEQTALAVGNLSQLTEIRERVGRLRQALRFFESYLPHGNDRGLLSQVRTELDSIEIASKQELDSPIALLGESGAGKSSLLNALVGMDLLPHNAGSAVTAAICEISGGLEGFRLTASLESRDVFVNRFATILKRLKNAASDAVDESDSESAQLVFDGEDRRLVESVTGMTLEECARQVHRGVPVSFLPEVKKAMSQDSPYIVDYMADETESLRDDARLYLSASEPLWPLVEWIRIQGFFPVLPDGLRLVDVPGLNDPDATRDRVAKHHLSRCKLIWLVLSAKRAATKEIVHYLKESGLLTKLELEGRLASMAIVVTHADQFDDEGLMKEFGLSEDASLDELLTKHREKLDQVTREALLKVWDQTVKEADGRVLPETDRAGRETLKRIPVFSVDSRQSLLLRGITKSKKEPQFKTDVQTGIPALRDWMCTDFVQREHDAHRENLLRRIQRIEQTLRDEFGNRASIKRALASLHRAAKGGMSDIKSDAATFLKDRLEAHSREKEIKAEAQAEVVIEAIKSGIEDAGKVLRADVPDRLSGIHWSTLRAIVRRGGVFHGSTRRWDLPEELAETITKKVVFRWAELFESFAKQFTQELESKCGDLMAQHRSLIHQAVKTQMGSGAVGWLDDLGSGTALPFEFDLTRAQLNQQLETERRNFLASLIESLRKELQPVFQRAADESGTGMKHRIIQILTTELKGIVVGLIPALTLDLEMKVREVIRMLLRQVETAHDRVSEISSREADNIEADLFNTSEKELRAQIEVLEQGMLFLEASPAGTNSGDGRKLLSADPSNS